MVSVSETLVKWVDAPDVEFVDATAEKNYKARARRISDVIALKKPDRVPVIPSFGMFPALDNGLTVQDVMNRSEKTSAAWLKTMLDFEPDAMLPPVLALPADAYAVLQYTPLKIPGRDVPADHTYQFDEREYIKAEDFYDAYLDDPTDFMLRTFLPTVCRSLEPLKALPKFTTMTGYISGILDGSKALVRKDVVNALQQWAEAGRIIDAYFQYMGDVAARMRAMGYPNVYAGTTSMPFDTIGDWFRGVNGIMLDMYRRPDKLKAVMAKRAAVEIEYGVSLANSTGAPVVGLMLHKGSRRFLSPRQFEEFYWPGLQEVMLGLIEAGFVPMPLFEGDYNTRLDIIKDIPKGKAIYWFEDIDIYEAKKVLGDRVCIRGNLPGTMLQFGTPRQVRDYVRELIDVLGRDGGLIVDTGTFFDEAKHENVRAMVDTAKQYGVLLENS